MTDTTLEEAKRCPTCTNPGRLLNRRKPRAPGFPRGTWVETYQCMNNRCDDYIAPQVLGNGTWMREERGRWFVQINPDGTVPPKGTAQQQPKAYDMGSPHAAGAIRGRDMKRLLAAQADRDVPEGGQAYEIRKDLGF